MVGQAFISRYQGRLQNANQQSRSTRSTCRRLRTRPGGNPASLCQLPSLAAAEHGGKGALGVPWSLLPVPLRVGFPAEVSAAAKLLVRVTVI